MPNDAERLKLAFAVYIAQLIIEADNRIDYREMKLWGQLFPRNLLRQASFVDDEGNLNADFEQARQEALITLPGSLSLDEKLELLTVLHGASMADGELEAHELDVLAKGADLLGIPPTTFTTHLAQLTANYQLGI
ncbi:MAG: hypothetical protein HN348_03910 [Proteobacteria bacterium]|jgi:uncharacterized tellurite resistance protein B-like protein|nr:hypothetical protein [Pseudomonadota bacterium]